MTTPSTASITPHFLEDLAALKQELAREGEVVAARLSSAIKGLVDHDLDMLDEVAIGDAEVNAMQIAIDDRAFKLLALHQPVAIDLRMIVAAIKSTRTSSGSAIWRSTSPRRHAATFLQARWRSSSCFRA